MLDSKKTMDTPALLRLRDVSMAFDLANGEQQVVFSKVNLEVKKGSLTLITGPSGVGKTTLLFLLSGFHSPVEGVVEYSYKNQWLDLRKINLDNFRNSRIGWIFQNLNLIPHLYVWQNVTLPMWLRGENSDKMRETASGILDSMGLVDKLDCKTKYLSSGEQQRVAIGRALSVKKEVILADEPTGNLDGKNTNSFIANVKLITEHYGVTFVIVTHDVRRLSKYATRRYNCLKTESGNEIVRKK